MCVFQIFAQVHIFTCVYEYIYTFHSYIHMHHIFVHVCVFIHRIYVYSILTNVPDLRSSKARSQTFPLSPIPRSLWPLGRERLQPYLLDADYAPLGGASPPR